VRVIASACGAAARDAVLYTIGVLPDHPATAYGYLEAGGALLDDGGVIHRKVRSFREKPDKDIAKRYLAVGDYLWNSGMFIWRTGVVLDAFSEHLPGHLAVLAPAFEARAGEEFSEADQEAALAEAFPRLPSVSVDYGIMEKAGNVRLVEATFTWNDLGSWPALSEFLPRDEADNGYRGRIAVHDGAANVVFCEDEDELVALVGVSDLVVVRAGKRTLVVARERVEEIKDLVRLLERDGREEDL
jgi:mannose-1-phosphate guanylyltransferase